MTCRDVSNLLLEHRAGEVPFRVRAVMRLHTTFCPCCRAMIASYGRTVEMSAELAAVEVPDDVAGAVEATLRGLE